MEDRHLSLSEVAGSLGVSERTVRRWIKSGKLRAYKPGRDYRIPESALRTLVNESEISPKALAPPSLFNGLEEERRTASAEDLLEEAGIETRWLTMPTDKWLAALREAFAVPDEAEADRKLISVGWEILREYQELNDRMRSGPIGLSGEATLAPEYVEAWVQAATRFGKTITALRDTEENPNAPEDAREGAHTLLSAWPRPQDRELRAFLEETEQDLPIRGHA